jgi:hypothetical protein
MGLRLAHLKTTKFALHGFIVMINYINRRALLLSDSVSADCSIWWHSALATFEHSRHVSFCLHHSSIAVQHSRTRRPGQCLVQLSFTALEVDDPPGLLERLEQHCIDLESIRSLG